MTLVNNFLTVRLIQKMLEVLVNLGYHPKVKFVRKVCVIEVVRLPVLIYAPIDSFVDCLHIGIS